MGDYMRIEAQNGRAVSLESGAEGLLEDEDTLRMEQLHKEIADIRKKESTQAHRLQEAQDFWDQKIAKLSHEVEALRAEAQAREVELSELQHPHHEAPKRLPGPKCLLFVQGHAFSGFSVLVILANLFTMFMQHFYQPVLLPYKEVVQWADDFYLSFYIVELLLRGMLMHCKLLHGPPMVVWWNWLDLIIVVSGVMDQWAIPALEEFGYMDQENESVHQFLRGIRLFRLARVLKVIHTLWVADYEWTDGHRFAGFMMIVVGVNSVTIALQADLPVYENVWYWFDRVFLVIYVFELSVRMMHQGHRFFCGSAEWGWNWMDAIIVFGGIVDQWMEPGVAIVRHCMGLPPQSFMHSVAGGNSDKLAQFMMVLRLARLFRILRLVRLIKGIRPLYTLVLGIVSAMQGMIWVVVLTFLFLYIWAILGVLLIGHGIVFGGDQPPINVAAIFPNVPEAMYVFFKVMNGDLSSVEPLFEVMPVTKVFVVTFMVVSSWAILSILTAVVSENMISATEEHRKECEQDDDDTLKLRSRMKLEEIFGLADTNPDGVLDKSEFQRLVQDEQKCDELSEACGLQKGELVQMFDLLCSSQVGHDGEVTSTIKHMDFLEGLEKQSATVTERAVMRLEKRLSTIERATTSIEVKSSKEMETVLRFLEQVNCKLDSMKDPSAMVETLAAKVDQRFARDEVLAADAAAAARASAQEAKEDKAETQRVLTRFEQRLDTDIAAAKEASATSLQASEAAREAKEAAEAALRAVQALADNQQQAILAQAFMANGFEKQISSDKAEAFAAAAEDGTYGLQAAAAVTSDAWGAKSLSAFDDDQPLPVPKPRFAGPAAVVARTNPRVAGTGEEPINAMVHATLAPGDGQPEMSASPVDPLDHLLN